MSKNLDISYCKYIELLISRLQECQLHPERYSSPELLKMHVNLLEERFSRISLKHIFFNKNICFKYKQKAFKKMFGLYKIGKLFRETMENIFANTPYVKKQKRIRKQYIANDFPEILQKEVLDFYDKIPAELLNDEKKQVLKYLQEIECFTDGIDIVFPYKFVNEYKNLQVSVYRDEKRGMYYVSHKGKKLFFPKEMDTSKKVSDYYKLLCLEQDVASPHCYTDLSFSVADGDVCLDIGCAEGNFALTNIEKVKKIYLFETDPKWIESLSMTFKPWEDKVEIINKFVSDKDDAQSITLDTFIKKENTDVTFIKIDAEGAEESILKGSKELLGKNNLKVVACTYHRNGDDKLLSDILGDAGFECRFSDGYMIFIFDEELSPPYLRKGLVRAAKNGDEYQNGSK